MQAVANFSNLIMYVADHSIYLQTYLLRDYLEQYPINFLSFMRQIDQQKFSKTLTLASRNFKKVKVK
jgi:hypothetical protein